MGGVSGNVPPVRLPERRELRVFAFDPMSSRLSGRLLRVDVRREPALAPGPVGELVQVVDFDAARNVWYQPVDLDDPAVLAQQGLRPWEGDPRTHQQVVYAVAMSVIERFERFLGRRFRWRADAALRLVPHAFEGRNAFFDPARRAVLFGYYRADDRDPGPNLPEQMMFTCLSVDIVAHEVTHAIVHRLREHFSEATNEDVTAWHEALADLVALFHHFLFRDVVADAVARSRGSLQEGSALLDLALEFGVSTGRGAALRSALGSPRTPEAFLRATEAHERGACFVAAVFDAYLDTYESRISDLRRLATGGSGVLPAGALPPDLVARVTDEAVKNAERLLGMVVRAFDYLPVVDPTFGDVLRAIVTADRDLYPDDAGQLRATLVEALRRRGIFPALVDTLTDESLTWPRPVVDLTLTGGPVAVDLSSLILNATRELDPYSRTEAGAERPSASGRRGGALAGLGHELRVWARAHAYELGLDPSSSVPVYLAGMHVTYRQAADRQPRPQLVLQFAQRRTDLEDQHLGVRRRAPMWAGTTVLARVDGHVDYVVAKPLPLTDPDRALDLAEPVRSHARASHATGQQRVKKLRHWQDRVTGADALAAWTDRPNRLGLSFARLHASQEQGR